MEYAPQHLRKETRSFWREILKEYNLEEHHKKILTLACKAWDRSEEAREVLDEKGITFIDRFDQPKTRPEVGIERKNRNDFRLLIRELGLDIEIQGEPGRMPRIKGKR
jgi:P27 family predicted phage terminase small subunit